MQNASLEVLKKTIKKNPKDPACNRLIGKAMLNEGNFKEALKYYQISTAFSPRIANQVVIDFEEYLLNDLNNIPARMALVDFHLLRGDLESAIIELEELVEIAPEVAQVYVLLGRIYLKLGRLEGAIKLLEKAREAGSDEVSLLEPLAGAYIEKERYADAILLYEEILRSDTSSKRALRILSELYSRLSNYDSAAKTCTQMLTDDPEVISEVVSKLEEVSKMSPNSSFIKEQLAQAYIRSLKPEQAVEELKKVVDLNPEKIETIISMLKNLLQTYPNNEPAMFFLAECLVKTRQFSEAVDIYNEIQKLDPSQSKKCMEGYHKVIKLYPEQALARQSIADVHFMAGNFKEALKEYGEVVRLNTAEAAAVEKRCKEILKQNPDMFEACVVMAESFLAGGDNRKAITLAEELVQKDNKCLQGFRILGEAYLNIDILNRAKDAFFEALKLSQFEYGIQEKYQTSCEKEIEREITSVKAKILQDPWRAGLNLDLAKLFYKKGNLSEALKALQIAVKDIAKAATSHNLMGMIFKEQGRFDLAKIQFEKALEFKNVAGEDIEKEIKSNLASCLEAQGRVQEAISVYEEVLALDIEFNNISKRIKYIRSANPFSIRNKAAALVFEGINSSKVMAVWGRDGRKSRTSEEGLSFISFGEEHNNRGFDDMLKEMQQSSKDSFSLATQLDASLGPAYCNLASVHIMSGELDMGETQLSRAVSDDHGNPVYANNMGVLNILKKEDEKAEKYFLSALKTDKDFSAAIINLADIKMRQKNAKEAMSLYKSIDQYDPLQEIVKRRLMYWAF